MNKHEKYLLSIFNYDLQRNIDKLVEPLDTSLLRYDYFVEVSKEHTCMRNKEFLHVKLVNTRYTDIGANVFISYDEVVINTYLNNNDAKYRLTEKILLDKEYLDTFYNTILDLDYMVRLSSWLAIKTDFVVSVPEINKSLKRYLKRYKVLSNKNSFQLTVLGTLKEKKYTFKINKEDIFLRKEPKLLKVVELYKPTPTECPYHVCDRDVTYTSKDGW